MMMSDFFFVSQCQCNLNHESEQTLLRRPFGPVSRGRLQDASPRGVADDGRGKDRSETFCRWKVMCAGFSLIS